MSTLPFKYKHPLAAFMAIWLLFLIVADVSIVSTHRRQMLSELKRDWESELDMTGIFIAESLLKHEYATVENFLLMMAKESNDILEMHAVTPNNFILVEYKREKASEHTFIQEKQIRYEGKVLLNLKVIRDFEPGEKMLTGLQLQLIAASILATTIMGVIIWFLIRKMALLPLEREMSERRRAEEMLRRTNDELEIKIQERTSELKNINENLLFEISERREVEAALKESEERYRAILDNARDGVLLADTEDKKFYQGNKMILEMLGYSQEEIMNLGVADIHPKEQLTHVMEQFERQAKGEIFTAEDIPVKRKDGSIFYADINSSLIKFAGRQYLIGVFRDVTERNETRRMLSEISMFNEQVLSTLPIGVATYDAEGQCTSFNDYGARLIGASREAALLQNFRQLDSWKRSGLAEAAERTLAFGQNSRRVVNVVSTFSKDVWLDCVFSRFVSNGRPKLLLVFSDITDSKRAENNLRISEERFRSIVSTSQEWIWAIDSAGRHTFSNPAIEKILGYTPDEIIGRDALSLIHEEDQQMVKKLVAMCIEQKTGWQNIILRWRRRDGTWRYLESMSVPILDVDGSLVGFRGTDRDVTERKLAHDEKERLRTQLIQAQKMEAIGQLAGGVAHDFNNIISAIVGYSHITLMSMSANDPKRRNLENILAASEKAANLTKSLLAFGRKQVMQMLRVNINDIIWDIKNILDRIIGEDIDLQVDAPANDLIINGDKNQLELVLINLVSNARDAMPDGGILKVSTGELEVDEHYGRMHGHIRVGTYAVLSVEDTGVGMDEKTKVNIFDPFFTTKEVGKGTGLGLAMIYGTVQQHKGFVNVYSEPGKGSTFRIYIPLVESEPHIVQKTEAVSIPSGTESILLVEDSQDVRDATKKLLIEFGYTVIEAVDGDEAIKLFRENKDSIHLVISDIIMPGISGKDLHNELIKISAEIKIIFISGYSSDILAKKGIIDSDVNFIFKPAKPEVLLNKVREVLDT